jgi:hypothetical protein
MQTFSSKKMKAIAAKGQKAQEPAFLLVNPS